MPDFNTREEILNSRCRKNTGAKESVRAQRAVRSVSAPTPPQRVHLTTYLQETGKRRKVKCIPSAESSICTGCLERSTSCIAQEYVDDDHSHHAEESVLARRVARIESLLETLMDRIPDYRASGLALSSTEQTVNGSTSCFPPWAVPSKAQSEIGSPTARLENLRQQLAAMLPCQKDVDCLLSSSHGWWLIQQHMMAHIVDPVDKDSHMVFNVSAVSKKHPTMIARLLFCVAICIQQLPPEVGMETIQTTTSLREMMSSIVGFLIQKVTFDDELIGNFEGVECLALQGLYEVNAGNLRRAWLCYRKAITIAQLLGLHRMSVQTDGKNQELALVKRHRLWYQISRGVSCPAHNVPPCRFMLRLTRNVICQSYSASPRQRARALFLLTTARRGFLQKTFTTSICIT